MHQRPKLPQSKGQLAARARVSKAQYRQPQKKQEPRR